VQSHFQGTRKAPQATVAKYRDAETKVKWAKLQLNMTRYVLI
jgi:hypothetical protein